VTKEAWKFLKVAEDIFQHISRFAATAISKYYFSTVYL